MLRSKVTSVKLAEEIKYVHDYLHFTGPTRLQVWGKEKNKKKEN